jgi:transglutaminase-like putative cysteine protease
VTPRAVAATGALSSTSGLALLNRRAAVLTGLFGLLAYAGGAGLTPLPAFLAGSALLVALFWQPDPHLSARLERVWLPLALLLVARALYHVLVVQGDVVLPVVDLLLLLLATEALRSLDTANDARLHALAFALLLAPRPIAPASSSPWPSWAMCAPQRWPWWWGTSVGKPKAGAGGTSRCPGGSSGGREPSRGWCSWPAPWSSWHSPGPPRGGVGRAPIPVPSMAGFSESVALGSHGARILPNPDVFLRVEFPDGIPVDPEGLYFRGRSYDRFDGIRWIRSRSLPPATAPVPWYRERWGGEELTQRIYAAPMESRVLFGVHPTVDVVPESRMQPALDGSGDLVYWGKWPPRLHCPLPHRPAHGGGAQGEPSGRLHAGPGFYLQRPGTLSPRVGALADSLVAGVENRYDRIQVLLEWFRSEFTYTTELPASARETGVEHFLFERQAGHCEYFATGMVVLLRSLGIPSRVVNGFLGGRWNDVGGYLAVTGNQAHAWVEVWFPGLGWVPFDPTPPGSVGAAAGTGRMAFGRFLLDGLQHRWGKWILDYSGSRQSDLLERASGFLGEEPLPDSPGEPASTPSPSLTRWFLLLGVAAILVGAARALLLRGPPLAPASAAWVRLRSAYARAGLPGADRMSPQELLQAVQRTGSPGGSTQSGRYGSTFSSASRPHPRPPP